MSGAIWGNPLTASTAIAIEDAHCQIKYPGIFVSNGKQFYPNSQSVEEEEYEELNRCSVTNGVICWSIANSTSGLHRLYFLYYNNDFNGHFWSIRKNNEVVIESFSSPGANYESVEFKEDEDSDTVEYKFAYFTWFTPLPHPLIETYYVDDWPYDEDVIRILSQWLLRGEPISYVQKPFNLNILGGDVWNFIAAEPGAWFYSIYDDSKNHHMYFLAGDEFKLLEFRDADGNGVIPHTEYHSTPIVLEGKRYHCLYRSWAVDSVCPFPTQYYKHDEFPSDEQIYLKLTDYVLNRIPYDRGDVLGLLALRNLLSANSGDVNVDLDDLKAMLKGYTVEERRNPYLDDPNLDDAGYPTTSFHD